MGETDKNGGNFELGLRQLALKCTNDPLLFVRKCFRWGKGPLENYEGPDKWQTEILTEIKRRLENGEDRTKAIQIAVASGHGIGKTAFVSWLILWAISTYPDMKGVVTAETKNQLTTKTWSELHKWHNLCIFRDWFEVAAESIFSTQEGHKYTWRIDAIPWNENNTDAFQGLHNQGKRILVLFDEASVISKKIYEVTKGALTDKNTQIIWAIFGNPTSNTGPFFEAFHRDRHRWLRWNIDSRTVKITNKEMLNQYVEDYGEDSDFVRVRVRGVFPSTGFKQLIDREIVENAMSRPAGFVEYSKMCAVVGVDVARFGDDRSSIATRIGLDATLPIKSFRGLDGWELGEQIALHVRELQDKGIPKVVIFVDATGVGASPVDWLKRNLENVIPIDFGGKASGNRWANRRAEMWDKLRMWLANGCLWKSEELQADLCAPEKLLNNHGQLLLESKESIKKRGLNSPDTADALALTFAQPVEEYLGYDTYRKYVPFHKANRDVRNPYD